MTAATARATADQTYTDRNGDSRGRIDILTARLTSSSSALAVRVNMREKTLNSNENIGVAIDTNGASSGVRVLGVDGFDYLLQLRGGGAGTLLVFRPSGAGWGPPASDPPGYSLSPYDFGGTISASLAALGNPSRIRFLLYAKEADEGSIVWDLAPDSGAWDFALVTSPPPTPTPQPPPPKPTRVFVAKGSSLVPNPPRAGGAVRVGTRFVYSGSGAAVTTGKLGCAGWIGSQRVPGRTVRRGAQSECVFGLPGSSGGQLFRGRVTLAVGARQASVERTARIARSSALTLTGPNTIPASAPTAGVQYSAAFKVELVRPGAPARRVSDGEVACKATVAGKPVSVDFKGFFQGSATCAWRIPASARGSGFVGTITVRSGGMMATKTFKRRVR